MFGSTRISISRSLSSRTSRASGPCTRIYGPRNLKDEFRMHKAKDEVEAVLHKIRKIYSSLKLDENLLDNGFCFGLLDPAANILVNSAISKGIGFSRARQGEDVSDLSKRSLNGLIAFLTRLFPYLPDAEALDFIDAAEADPVVASILVIRRRGIGFDLGSMTNAAAVEAALVCAAVAAKHHDPEQLVLRWKLLSPDLNGFIAAVARYESARTVLYSMSEISDAMECSGTSGARLQLKNSFELAEKRLAYPLGKVLPPARAAMKRILLGMIHGFYLQVLARLPTAEPNRYYRSMLMGGYCYGPLDPVSNIIVNTIWYEKNFPMTVYPPKMHMISTKALWRVAARSLFGLVSFLCTRYPRLTPDLAMQRLQVFGANLQAADPRLYDMPNATRSERALNSSWSMQVGSGRPGTLETQLKAVEKSAPCVSAQEAYAAAATAAFHPNPVAHQVFLGSSDSPSKLQLVSEALQLQDGRVLSFADLNQLQILLFQRPSSADQLHQEHEPKQLSKRNYAYIARGKARFWDKHNRVTSMVEAALSAYNCEQQLQANPYFLHVICGVNELVSGPEFSLDKGIGDDEPWTPFKYHHSHINFLATQGGDHPAVLFFAECSNDGTERSWCIPVHPEAEQVRCIYCEYEEVRILHPAMKTFQGCGAEFEKVQREESLFYGLDKEFYTNDEIIGNNQIDVDWVHDVGDDHIFSTSYAYDDGDKETFEDFLNDIEVY